jgi:hypothetical protein
MISKVAERLEHHIHEKAVIQTLRDNPLADAFAGTVHRDRITKLNFGTNFVSRHPKVNKQIIERDRLTALRIRQEVCWTRTWLENATQGLTSEAMHQDTLCNQDTGIEATKRLQADKAFVIDMPDDKTDFIHMGGNQHFGALTTALFVSNDITHGIDMNRIDQGSHRILNHAAHDFFATWDTGRFTD